MPTAAKNDPPLTRRSATGFTWPMIAIITLALPMQLKMESWLVFESRFLNDNVGLQWSHLQRHPNRYRTVCKRVTSVPACTTCTCTRIKIVKIPRSSTYLVSSGICTSTRWCQTSIAAASVSFGARCKSCLCEDHICRKGPAILWSIR